MSCGGSLELLSSLLTVHGCVWVWVRVKNIVNKVMIFIYLITELIQESYKRNKASEHKIIH